jgi:hypothetical protein
LGFSDTKYLYLVQYFHIGRYIHIYFSVVFGFHLVHN